MAVTSQTPSAQSSFAAGVEFEETFPESAAPAVTPAPTTASSRPTVIGDNETTPAPRPAPVRQPAPAPRREPESPRRDPLAPAAAAAPAPKRDDMSDAAFEERLERRMRNAEAVVKETIAHARAEEEKRLAEWTKSRHEEEERRLAAWVAERRADIEKTMEVQHRTDMTALKSEIERMLVDWQGTFEERFRSELAAALKEMPLREATVRDRQPDVRAVVTIAPTARDLGRILRDLLADFADTSSFALALHDAARTEVVYRYRVAAEDEIGASLRGELLDDGPESAVAHMNEWVRGQRVVRIDERNLAVHTAQYAVRDGDSTIGVVTIQSADVAVADEALAKFAALIETTAGRLAELRDRGSFRSA